jgi:hypothetical protein
MASMTLTVDDRVERLSAVSLRQHLEPDEMVQGCLGEGQVLPDELLSVAGLGLDLTVEQRATLAREELASICEAGIRFEAALTAGFSLALVGWKDLTDPRVTYILHELGEETRHSRLFVRLLEQMQPAAVNPLHARLPRLLLSIALPRVIQLPSLFLVLVLTGEEIPDLFQKLAAEDERTDGLVRAVSAYHRREEARHLAFARMLLPEAWSKAGSLERFVVRHLAPAIVGGMFDSMVHPGVYATVGLPKWSTWREACKSNPRRELRRRAVRPLLDALEAAGAFRGGRLPRSWRRLAGDPTTARRAA